MQGAMEQMGWIGTGGPRYVARSVHRHWLVAQALSLFAFFQPASFNPAGGFFTLADDGTPNPPRPGHTGVERQISMFEGVEYQITEKVAVDFSAAHFALWGGTLDHQVIVGLTVSTGHLHTHR